MSNRRLTPEMIASLNGLVAAYEASRMIVLTKFTQFTIFIVVMIAAAALFIFYPRLASWFGHVNQALTLIFMIGYGAYLVKGTVAGRFGTGAQTISRERPLPFYGLLSIGLLFEPYLILDFLGVRMPWAR